MRIEFSQKAVSYADTLGAWYDFHKPGQYEYHEYLKYFDHFSTGSSRYFLAHYEYWLDRFYLPYLDGAKIVIKEGTQKLRRCGTVPGIGWDIMEPYMIERTRLFEAKNGYWLVSGIFNNAFVDKNDSLSVFINRPLPDTSFGSGLISILGKVRERYLGVFRKKDQPAAYYLINPDSSPYIDSTQSVKVNFTHNDFGKYYNPLIEIRNVKDSLYLVQSYPNTLYLYSLSGSSFSYIKTVNELQVSRITDIDGPWEIRNGKLFYINGYQLVCYDYVDADTSFMNKRVLLDSLFVPSGWQGPIVGMDKSQRYWARLFINTSGIGENTLKVYDVDKEMFISSIGLGDIREPFQPVVDSPYVYIHQITRQKTEVGVEHDADNKTPLKFSLSAYPNPFNPVSTICYTIPSQALVELKVYDMLGREVSSLVNEQKSAGEYKVQFDGSSLPSGVYIYAIQAGSFRDSKKLLLLK
ncbi:MAG: T9SS type A sorting domain-containing protein [Syntrophothermus sp.]